MEGDKTMQQDNNNEENIDLILKSCKEVLKDMDKLKKHICFMRYNSHIAWFNVLAILYQNINAEKVMTSQKWQETYGEMWIKKGERAYMVYVPIVTEVNHLPQLKWKSAKVFDINQIELKTQEINTLDPVINNILNEINQKEQYIEQYWEYQVILNTMKKCHDYKNLKDSNEDLLKPVMNAVLYAYQDIFEINLPLMLLSDIDEITAIRLYKLISESISGINEEFNNLLAYAFHKEKIALEKEKIEKYNKKINMISHMSLKERLEYARSVLKNEIETSTEESVNTNAIQSRLSGILQEEKKLINDLKIIDSEIALDRQLQAETENQLYNRKDIFYPTDLEEGSTC